MGLHQPLKNTAQLAIRVLGVAGVAEDAAVQEGAVDVANHRAEVAGSVLLARLAFALLDGGDVVAQRHLPVPAVGLEIKSPVSERHEVISRLPLLPPPALRLIDRVDWLAALGDLHVRLRQDELTDLSSRISVKSRLNLVSVRTSLPTLIITISAKSRPKIRRCPGRVPVSTALG